MRRGERGDGEGVESGEVGEGERDNYLFTLLPYPTGWPRRALVTLSVSHTPFPPKACIGGMASTRFPCLVLDDHGSGAAKSGMSKTKYKYSCYYIKCCSIISLA